MAEAVSPPPPFRQYCIILNTDSKGNRSLTNKRSAIAGGIWFLDGHGLTGNEHEQFVMLKSTVDKCDHTIQTSRTNIKLISPEQYNFLIAVKPELRLDLLAKPIFSDLLKIKVYDKVTVLLTSGPQRQKHQHECIVHYIGPVHPKRGYYLGVVFEVSFDAHIK